MIALVDINAVSNCGDVQFVEVYHDFLNESCLVRVRLRLSHLGRCVKRAVHPLHFGLFILICLLGSSLNNPKPTTITNTFATLHDVY